jgi:hypothetical protein
MEMLFNETQTIELCDLGSKSAESEVLDVLNIIANRNVPQLSFASSVDAAGAKNLRKTFINRGYRWF